MRVATIVIGLGFVCGCGAGPVGPTSGGPGAESNDGTTLPGGGGAVPAVIAVYTATTSSGL